MSFPTAINLATIILCGAVLVQSLRLMRLIARVQGDEVTEQVAAMDRATAEARGVLASLQGVLSHDVAEAARTLPQARAMREELTVLLGLADVAAERLVSAAQPPAPPTPPASARPKRRMRAVKAPVQLAGVPA